MLSTLTPDDPRHGTANGYGNHGCRCIPCRAANTIALGINRRKKRVLPPGDPRHGTDSGRSQYWDCKCELCRPGLHKPPPPPPPAPVPENYLNLKETALILGVTRQRVHQLYERGDLAAVSLYPAHACRRDVLYFDRYELENYSYPGLKINKRRSPRPKVTRTPVSEEYVTVLEAAKIIGISRSRLHRLTREGLLSTVQFEDWRNVYYLRADVQDFVPPKRQPSPPPQRLTPWRIPGKKMSLYQHSQALKAAENS